MPRFGDEIAALGIAPGAWIARRRETAWSYVGVAAARADEIGRRFPGRAARTVEAADRILRHEFDLLGSGPFQPVAPAAPRAGGYVAIDWLLDPVAQLRFSSGIPHKQWNLETMRPQGADIKLPWELARCQHWLTLAQAWRLTGDDRYSREIAHELDDFMRSNPVGIGIHWTCTMDVAIRAANWALALDVIRGADAWSLDAWRDAYSTLFDHAVFIENNLENAYEVTSNHFLSNVVGLLYLSCALDGLSSAARWRARCREWLEQEMRVQVLDDGADYESSVPYHRLVTELFLGAARLARLAGEPLSDAFERRLRLMVEFFAGVLRPDGLMPLVGDADDGRLHILGEYGSWQPQDGRHLLGPASAYFGVADWMTIAGEAGEWEAAWWGFDPPAAPAPAPASNRSAHYPGAGITVLRASSSYVLVTNGKVGTAGFGNHKHCDQLGFEYHVGGVALLVDPGSHVYTSDPASRNLFRSTRSHNTLMIDGEEQNDFRLEWLFRMFEHAPPQHVRFSDGADAVEYVGRHFGYTRLASPVVHERRIALRRRNGALEIEDTLEGAGEHELAWHFHCAPGVVVKRVSDRCFELGAPAVRARLEIPPGLSAAIAAAAYSPSYGVRQQCVAIDARLRARTDSGRAWRFLVTPVESC